MYSRQLDGLEYTFGVTGKLWHGVLVLFDRETGSFWTQLDGRAIQGEELGRRLAHVPSVFTTWEAWRAKHPNTLVLAKDAEARAQRGSHYADYFADPERTYLPHLGEGLGEAAGAKDVVFGIRIGDEGLAVTEARLEREGVVNARLGERPVAWLRDAATGEVRAVAREAEGRRLQLEAIEGVAPTARVRDRTTGDEHAVAELEPLRVDRAFWYAWARTVTGARLLVDPGE